MRRQERERNKTGREGKSYKHYDWEILYKDGKLSKLLVGELEKYHDMSLRGRKVDKTSLGLVNLTVVEEAPSDRSNIRYAVITSKLKEDSKDEHLSVGCPRTWKDLKGETEKVLIFCADLL